jgi:hypothetical protein
MASSTIKGYWRQKGTKNATPVVGLQALKFSFDPTQATATVSKTLPSGAIPLFVQNMDGGATGGTSPTLDVGTSGDSDGFANELVADSATGLTNTGALLGVELTAETEVYAGVGASAATGGTVNAILYYIMSDSGAA